MSVPVHVLGGFLGVGKTTTVRALLRAAPPGERVAVVVNDFGEARIDATVLSDGTRVESIEGGCVCCTAPRGLASSVATLLDEVKPTRIVIEPSGLARPQDVVDLLLRGPLAARVELRPTLVLVDPGADPAHHGALDHELWEAGEILVANRCDLATPAQLEAFRARAAARWPAPLRVVETTFGALPPEVWALRRERAAVGHHDHDHAHHAHPAPSTEGFAADSALRPRERTYAWASVEPALTGAAGLARFKGLLRTDQGWLRVDVAGGRLHAEPTAWRQDSRWDVICAAPADPGAVTRALDAAESPATAGGAVELVGADGSTRVLGREALAALPGQVPDVGVLVPGRVGAGVYLREVLSLGGPAAAFAMTAEDGLTTAPAPLSAAGEAVLLHSLGDGPLPAGQGGPFRVLGPTGEGRTACANVKGLARVRLLAE